MKIRILTAVLLSTLALSSTYAADEAMPASDNMTQNAAATTDQSGNKTAEDTAKAPKKHKKHKKNKKNCHSEAATTPAAAEPAVEPAK